MLPPFLLFEPQCLDLFPVQNKVSWPTPNLNLVKSIYTLPNSKLNFHELPTSGPKYQL